VILCLDSISECLAARVVHEIVGRAVCVGEDLRGYRMHTSVSDNFQNSWQPKLTSVREDYTVRVRKQRQASLSVAFDTECTARTFTIGVLERADSHAIVLSNRERDEGGECESEDGGLHDCGT
jgi:hypothetical protein